METTDRVYIVGIEYVWKGSIEDFNVCVFANEADTIEFLNNHTADEFTANPSPDFIVNIFPFGDNPYAYFDPSPALEAAVEAANNR